ncbi:MAG: hypothetical protein KDH96_11570 [Candidatus Riesia sp.]|nr:hypothetical protein [Candidatus Riesia sp.]
MSEPHRYDKYKFDDIPDYTKYDNHIRFDTKYFNDGNLSFITYSSLPSEDSFFNMTENAISLIKHNTNVDEEQCFKMNSFLFKNVAVQDFHLGILFNFGRHYQIDEIIFNGCTFHE